MKKRCLSNLKGNFLHVHKSNNHSGIISNLLQSGGNNYKLKSGKIYDVYKSLTNQRHNCAQCANYFTNMKGGHTNHEQEKKINEFELFNKKINEQNKNSSKKVYVENKDICFVGTRVKLVNPNIVTINGKKVSFNYKSIVRRCNKHEHKIKHKK